MSIEFKIEKFTVLSFKSFNESFSTVFRINIEYCALKVHLLGQLRKYIVACQAHPALVKIGLVLACIFHFNSLLVCMH